MQINTPARAATTPESFYAQRLREEQARLDAVGDALAALDMERFQSAVRRAGNSALARSAATLSASRDVADAMNLMEALAGFLAARVEYLKPLALEERQRERNPATTT